MQCLPLVRIFVIIVEPFQANFMFDNYQHCLEIIKYCFRFSLLYDEIIWYSIFHVCMMNIQRFQLLMMISQMDYYMSSYGYLPHTACVWCVCMFSLCMAFLTWLRKGVVVTCQSGSTRCTTSCHCLFSLEYCVCICMDFIQIASTGYRLP